MAGTDVGRRVRRPAGRAADAYVLALRDPDLSSAENGPVACISLWINSFSDMQEKDIGMVQIEYGTRSAREAKDWICNECGATNKARKKLLFNLPKFACDCGKEKYFDRHALDFSIADIKINGIPLVQGVYAQRGGECLANALCKGMEILDAVDSLKKEMEPNTFKSFSPEKLSEKYAQYYPLMAGIGPSDQPVPEESVHKLIKMLLILRDEGIEMEDSAVHKIGDVSMIPGDDYEAILEELADGYPLMGMFNVGHSFDKLQYCEWYIPPTFTEVIHCNKKPVPHKPHDAHIAVLLGAAEREGEQGFHYINSYGVHWCSRKVLDGTINAARGGLSKIPKDSLISNVIKLWHPDEVATGSMILQDEDDAYKNNPFNLEIVNGDIGQNMLLSEGWVFDDKLDQWMYNYEGQWFIHEEDEEDEEDQES